MGRKRTVFRQKVLHGSPSVSDGGTFRVDRLDMVELKMETLKSSGNRPFPMKAGTLLQPAKEILIK
jgi:hypothetical protein